MSEEKVKVAPADKREVQAKWLDMQLARKNFDYVAAIFGQKLPKAAYSKRKNGKKKRLNNTAIRRGEKKTGNVSVTPDSRSKYAQFFQEYMKAGMILRQAEQAFSDILKKQEKKGKGSIKALIEEQTPKAVA